MEIEELKSRLDALEAENNRLKADNLELSGELQLWKPSARVEIAQPADRRTTKDFVNPRPNIRQFKISEALAIPEGDLIGAISNHFEEQAATLKSAPQQLIENARNLYVSGLAKALRGTHKDARREGYKAFSHALILEKFGFQTFVPDAELRGNIF